MNYSLDEAAALISKNINKDFSARQIRELAINGKIALCFLFRGTAYNCSEELEEEIYGWPIVLPGFISEIEIRGSYPANMFFYNNFLYKVLSPNFAVILTKENLLIHETYINKLVNMFISSEKIEEPKHEKLQIKQERLILEAIEYLGFDRYKLPKNIPGKAGLKKTVKDYVTSDYQFIFLKGNTVFDKAWERLLKKKEISYLN